MTTTTASARFTATIASAMIAAGILAGAAVSQTHNQNLADYGAAITADNSTGTAAPRACRTCQTTRPVPATTSSR